MIQPWRGIFAIANTPFDGAGHLLWDELDVVFDWVIRATGNRSVALTYGVIWRYAQMRAAFCYASCDRLAADLGCSRYSIMRHAQALLALGLLRCVNPDAVGVPHAYLPVSREEWEADRGVDAGAAAPSADVPDAAVPNASPATPSTQPVASCHTPRRKTSPPQVAKRHTPCRTLPHPPVSLHHTPCGTLQQEPVAPCNTRNTIRNTNTIPKRARPKAAPPPSTPSPRARGEGPGGGRAADARTRIGVNGQFAEPIRVGISISAALRQSFNEAIAIVQHTEKAQQKERLLRLGDPVILQPLSRHGPLQPDCADRLQREFSITRIHLGQQNRFWTLTIGHRKTTDAKMLSYHRLTAVPNG